MGVIRREGVYSSVVIYLGVLLSFVLSLFIYPKYLRPEEVGLVRVLLDMSTLIVPFLLLGIQNTYVRYHPYFKHSKVQLGAFRMLSILIPGVGTLLLLALFTLAKPYIISSLVERSPMMVEYIEWLPLLIVAMGGMKLMKAYFRSDLNITISNLHETILLRLAFIGAVLSYHYLDLELAWLVYLFIGAHALVLCSMILAYAARGNFYFSFRLSEIDPAKRRELLYYGLFVIANMLSGSIIVKIDSWMISSMAGLGATGVYAIALALGSIIELPRKSLTQISVPVLANAWKNQNLETIKDIFHKTSLNQLIAGGLIFTLVWINIDDLFLLIPNGEIYAAGKWVVFFIGLSKLFAISTGANIEILSISNFYRYSLFVRLILVITAIGTNLYFIPIYGITGAAIATSISILSNNIILYFVVLAKLKMQPFRVQNFYALLWLGAMFVLGYFMPLETGYPVINIAARSLVIVLLFVLLIMRFNFAADIRELIVMALKKLGINYK